MTAVLITGASSGFGRMLAEKLAVDGYRVAAGMREPGGRNASAAEALRSAGCNVLDMDVTSDASVERAVGEAGHLDVVVNNAGFANFGVTESYTVDQVRQIFETNVFGVVRVNRAVLPPMRRQGSGLLIHISSGAGRLGLPYMGPYCATKFALEALAECWRQELAPCGIESVVVEPGKFRTDIFGKMFEGTDGSRAEEYGAANLSERFIQNFIGDMDRRNPDPMDVVRAVQRLIEMPAGERPFRTPVGADVEPFAPYNAIADDIRKGVCHALGVPELLQLNLSGR